MYVSLVTALSVSGLWFQGRALCCQEWSAVLFRGQNPRETFFTLKGFQLQSPMPPGGHGDHVWSLEAGRAVPYNICSVDYISAKRVLRKALGGACQTPVPI